MDETRTFRELEHEGWLDRATYYRNAFGAITSQAIRPILDALGDVSGKRFLDIACGTGELAATAAGRGALAEGVDFASTMVERATAAHTAARFREGDAEHLPYEAASFDAATCSFGILHVEHPEVAVAEARRVLVDGGMFAFTAWCTPAQGNDFFELVLGAVQEHGTMDVPLPPAPPFFRFSDADECTEVLRAAGFENVEARVIDLRWRPRHAEDALELVYRSGVRTPMILEAQSPEARDRIHRAILDGTEQHRRGDAEMRLPAMLTTAVAA